MTVVAPPAGARAKQRQAKHAQLVINELAIRAVSEQDQLTGFCGTMSGTALPYMVRDAYGTAFRNGCLDKTRTGRVAARKVKLFLDHSYGVRTHVGTVLELNDVAGGAVMVAGLFDTPEGREAKEYLSAVIASRSETGLSVGFYDRDSAMGDLDGDPTLIYEEIELEEISITPRQAVPGATVIGVRMEGEELSTAERVFRLLAESLPAERTTAILAEVHSARSGTPPALAPVTPSVDETTDQAHASTKEDTRSDDVVSTTNVPVAERVSMFRSALSTK